MDKQQITQRAQESENNCRLYFDKLSTLQQQVQQVTVLLEQERGKLKAFTEIRDSLPDQKVVLPEEDQHLIAKPPSLPTKQSLIPVPSTKK